VWMLPRPLDWLLVLRQKSCSRLIQFGVTADQPVVVLRQISLWQTDSIWCYDRSPCGIYVIDISMSDCKSDDIAFIVPWKWISFKFVLSLWEL
jgi:hypothetical protein